MMWSQIKLKNHTQNPHHQQLSLLLEHEKLGREILTKPPIPNRVSNNRLRQQVGSTDNLLQRIPHKTHNCIGGLVVLDRETGQAFSRPSEEFAFSLALGKTVMHDATNYLGHNVSSHHADTSCSL